MNVFRKIWLAAKIKAALGGNMDSAAKVFEWLFKLKFFQKYRRKIGLTAVALSAVLPAITPLAAAFPAIMAWMPMIQKAGAYVALIGAAYKDDPQ